jgi:spermidine synthase
VLITYFVLGAYTVCAQATLLRETQLVLFGSELSWGLVLAFWLAGVALGARLGGRLLDLVRRPWLLFTTSNLAMPIFFAAEVAFLRGSRSLLESGPGEYVGLWDMLLVAAAATVPVSVWIGLAFPAASALLGQRQRETTQQARSVGRVYIAEATGSLVGGALFSFVFVEHLAALTLVIGGGGLLAAATSYLASGYSRSRTVLVVALTWVSVSTVVLASGTARRLEDVTVRWRWETFAGGLELIRSDNSKYQNLALGQLAGQHTLYTNGTVAATWPDHSALAIEAHLAASQHPAPNQMLVLGGGAEGLLKELLHHGPERLDYVTLDEKLHELMVPHLAPPDSEAVHSPLSHVHHLDVRRFVKRVARRGTRHYDLILLAAPEPATTLEARLYTEEFFAELSQAMAPGGVLALSLAGSAGAWGAEMAAYVGSVVLSLESVFPEVVLTFGDPVRIFAARERGVLVASGAELAVRYRSRGVMSPHFTPLWFEGASDMMDPEKRASVWEALESQPPRHHNTDAKPAAAVYHLQQWLATTGSTHGGEAAPAEGRAGFLSALLGLRLGWVLVAIVLATLLAVLVGLGSGPSGLRRTAVLWSLGTTGFAGMAIEIVLLHTFQIYYGYVYGMVGLVIGVFMSGLVVGSLLMNRRLGAEAGRHGQGTGSTWSGLRTLLLLDTAVVVFATSLILALGILRAAEMDLLVQLAVFCLVAVAGLLGGLAFPLAAFVWFDGRAGAGRTAAAVAAADDIGGSVGALVTGVALVPILGVVGTCFVVAAMKVLSALLVAGSLKVGSSMSAVTVSSA